MLSHKTGIPFFDGDDFHPQFNIDKMASGKPLNDHDRSGWLKNLNNLAQKQSNINGAIIACSALKESYRNTLKNNIEDNVNWVFLKGTEDIIQSRLESRTNHFMPKNLLKSQFEILEIPEYGLHLGISNTPETLINTIVKTLDL